MSRLKRQLSRLSGCGASSTKPPAPTGSLPDAPAPQTALAAPAEVTGPAPLPDGRAARVEALRARLAAYGGRRRAHAQKVAKNAAALPGDWEETPEGGMHVLRERHPPAHAHGLVPLAHSLRATGAHMAAMALDDTLLDVASDGLLYVDTETTGLAGGAGTLPFLIGLGRFVGGHWEMEQLFLRRPGEEAPMLHHLAARMRQASAMVTYNGKSYDWPLLRTRFILNRVPLPPALPHLDLLHCARRLLPQLAGGARLCHVERTLLAFERHNDVDGALIPQLYFDFLRDGQAGPMGRVMTHNAHDLAALAAMLGAFAERLDATPQVTIGAPECLAMARLYERRGDMPKAHVWAERAAHEADAPSTAIAARLAAGEAHSLRGRLHLRAGAFAEAAASWQGALALTAGHMLHGAHVRLALSKLYEHRLKDVARALEHAPHTAPAEGQEGMARRVARLQRKHARHT